MSKGPLILISLIFVLCIPSWGQELTQIVYPDQFKILHRYDFRIKENNRYQGLAYREVRGILNQQEPGSYAGQYFVLQETKKDNRYTINGVNQVLDINLNISPKGDWISQGHQAYPVFRNFPSAPPEGIKVGQRWTSYGQKVIDPLNDGNYTTVPILCEYEYRGLDDYLGEQVHVITGQYALRYQNGDDPQGDRNLLKTSGKHVIAFYVSLEGKPIFMRDTLTDEFYYNDGRQIEHKGFHLTWYKDIIPLQRSSLIAELERSLSDEIQDQIDQLEPGNGAGGSGAKDGSGTGGTDQAGDFSVSENEEGVMLTMNTLNFYPDQATLLPGEDKKLSQITKVLQAVPDRTFHVLGHTADVGSAESQQSLSMERAKTVAKYLMNNGIDPRRILFEGRGGREPVADNNTDEGRAQNRRVEIVIMED